MAIMTFSNMRKSCHRPGERWSGPGGVRGGTWGCPKYVSKIRVSGSGGFGGLGGSGGVSGGCPGGSKKVPKSTFLRGSKKGSKSCKKPGGSKKSLWSALYRPPKWPKTQGRF
jgi:hypothetical protein